ncbi:YcxB family protein [Methyloligella sp. 2.7D]|uniref:YcxB family protein n=1 Tax=unclassified Methyloligella TaxID=2625955 RepID=UPI00157C4DE5|nr:YcxB family protein [Methyloligella sp. GL2]QKP78614.1 YcxB family protein [Methyloligella sp. GL2]
MAYTIHYTYGYDDFAGQIAAKRSRSLFGQATPYIVVTGLYLLLMALQLWQSGIGAAELTTLEVIGPVLGGIPIIVMIVAVIDFMFFRLIYRLVFRRYALADTPMTVGLDDEGITWRSAEFSGQCIWAKVTGLVQTKQSLFVFLNRAEAIALPRRAMASDQEFDAIAAFAKKRIQGADQ